MDAVAGGRQLPENKLGLFLSNAWRKEGGRTLRESLTHPFRPRPPLLLCLSASVSLQPNIT